MGEVTDAPALNLSGVTFLSQTVGDGIKRNNILLPFTFWVRLMGKNGTRTIHSKNLVRVAYLVHLLYSPP